MVALRKDRPCPFVSLCFFSTNSRGEYNLSCELHVRRVKKLSHYERETGRQTEAGFGDI